MEAVMASLALLVLEYSPPRCDHEFEFKRRDRWAVLTTRRVEELRIYGRVHDLSLSYAYAIDNQTTSMAMVCAD